MSRPLTLALAALAAVLGPAGPAAAITSGGQPDEGRHPNVGALLTADDEPFCSGTLVAPRVVVTASHCVAYGAQAFGDEARVTFSASAAPGSNPTVLTGEYRLNPAFRPNNFQNDVSAIVLDAPLTGVDPAELPEQGELDDLRRAGDLRRAALTVVGYGSQQLTVAPGVGPVFAYLDERWYAVGQFMKLDKTRLQMAQQQPRGLAGACYGDSGGPTFLGEGDDEGTTVLGVTSSGDAPCLAVNVVSRADTPNAVAFLDDVLDGADDS